MKQLTIKSLLQEIESYSEELEADGFSLDGVNITMKDGTIGSEEKPVNGITLTRSRGSRHITLRSW